MQSVRVRYAAIRWHPLPSHQYRLWTRTKEPLGGRADAFPAN